MGMSPVPRADRPALDFMRVFVVNTSSRPSAYGLMLSDVQAMQKSLKQFEDAMAANQRARSCIELRHLRTPPAARRSSS